MEPVTLSIVAAVVTVALVGGIVASARSLPGHLRRVLALGIAIAELVAGSLLLLSGDDVGTVQQATGAAFLAAAFVELGDAAKRSVDAREWTVESTDATAP